MKAPAFWWREGDWRATLLAPAGALYGAFAARRLRRPGIEAGLPVICIGNLVAGGAGKTPLALAVAQRLIAQGERVAFLSRGYGGRLPGPVVVDAATHDAAAVGDEPLLLDALATTIVSRDRVAGARLARDLGASVVVMDDGLQNPALHKTLCLAAVDAATGIGNGRCLPAGPLRAPLDSQLPHVDALMLIGRGAAGEALAARAGKPVLRGWLEPDAAAAALFSGRKVLAFAGIGRPEKFFDTLRDCGAELVRTRAFSDHAPLAASDAMALLAEAEAQGLLPVTTEKDAARMRGVPHLAALAAATATLPVTLCLDAPSEEALAALLADAVAGTPSASQP